MCSRYTLGVKETKKKFKKFTKIFSSNINSDFKNVSTKVYKILYNFKTKKDIVKRFEHMNRGIIALPIGIQLTSQYTVTAATRDRKVEN